MKSPLIKILSAIVAGIAVASGGFFFRAADIASVGFGLAAKAGIPVGSWSDRLAATAFGVGGWTAVVVVKSLLVALPWTAGIVAVFWAAGKLPARRRLGGMAVAWLFCAGVAGFGFWNGAGAWRRQIRDIRLLAPSDLLGDADRDGGRIFYGPALTGHVALFAPRLLDPSLDQRGRADRLRSLAPWRNDENSFSGVVLSGSLSESRVLGDYLLSSPGWYLKRVDNQGLYFRRGNAPDVVPAPADQASGEYGIPRERGIFLAQSAISLDASGLKIPARSTMDLALKTSPDDAFVLGQAASLAASQGRWAETRSLAERALAKEPSSRQAAYLQALAFLETRAFEKALAATERLIAVRRPDTHSLLLHARAAQAAKDYTGEVASLEKLLALSEAAGVPATQVHIYLGQAWARRGFPEQALEHYQAALGGELAATQERDIREAIQTIKTSRLSSEK